jgi:uncharacterized protein YacL
MANVHVQIGARLAEGGRLKLIELARQIAQDQTNDFNLNKVAPAAQVLNINELANSLKPVVLPGEVMRVSC